MSPPQQIRVIVGEDQPFVRKGILRVLEEGGFDVAGTAGDARDLARMAEAYRPDVIIADIQMPPDHGDDPLRAVLAIRAARPGRGCLCCPPSSRTPTRSPWSPTEPRAWGTC